MKSIQTPPPHERFRGVVIMVQYLSRPRCISFTKSKLHHAREEYVFKNIQRTPKAGKMFASYITSQMVESGRSMCGERCMTNARVAAFGAQLSLLPYIVIFILSCYTTPPTLINILNFTLRYARDVCSSFLPLGGEWARTPASSYSYM